MSPSAEELCGTLGTENRKMTTRESGSKRLTERERETAKKGEKLKEGAAWMVSASTKKNKVLYPIIISTRILCTYTPGCLYATVNPAVGIICYVSRCHNTKGRERRRVGWLRMWGSSSEGNTTNQNEI